MDHKNIEASTLKELAEKIAKDCYEGLSEKDRQFLRENPDPGLQHFGLGLYIRNRYLHRRDHEKDRQTFRYSPEQDSFSYEIVKLVIAEVLKEGGGTNGGQ